MSHSIIYTERSNISELSIAGSEIDPFDGDWPDEPFEPTFDDTAYFDPDDDDDDELPPTFGGVMRTSKAYHDSFWTYYDRFVRYWPRKSFHVKHAYEKGFVEKKRRHTGRSLPLFEEHAIQMTERHLCSENWSDWKGDSYPDDPIWLGLHMPKSTTVDLIDVDAKQYRVGYYHERGDKKARLLPVINIPLEHFKTLKRIYDAFPGRIWCISSETLGIHAWRKHKYPQPSAHLHQNNKLVLANIGLPSIESHPMPGRCLRRPFGDGYRTITASGTIENWVSQVDYFESDGRTPYFKRICCELVQAMYRQWQAWERLGDDNPKVDVRSLLAKQIADLTEIADWLKAGCPLETELTPSRNTTTLDPAQALCQKILLETLAEPPLVRPTPTQRICQELLLVTFGEKSDEDIAPTIKEAIADTSDNHVVPDSSDKQPLPRGANQRQDLQTLRGGNWAKGLLRLAQKGLEQEDSVAMVVHEMAKWLWWIELYSLPESQRREEITSLLTSYVMTKHNNCVSRLLNGHQDEVFAQVARCVKQASEIKLLSSIQGFARTRTKWSNGGYTNQIRLIPALTMQEDISLSPSCQFTVMCIKFEYQFPDSVQAKIKAVAGRNKVMPFATKLISLLYSKHGKAFIGRKLLTALLGYENPNQIAKYTVILERAGIVSIGNSYKVGRNGKEYRLSQDTMEAMKSIQPLSET